jgi:hypothetical protein
MRDGKPIKTLSDNVISSCPDNEWIDPVKFPTVNSRFGTPYRWIGLADYQLPPTFALAMLDFSSFAVPLE